jgi:uroporphyrinogen-III decarboxylase
MNGRERLLTTLQGGEPDRVPVSPFVQEEFLSYLYKGEKVDRVTDAVACARQFDFDVMPRSRMFETPHFMKKSFPNWELDVRTYVEDGIFYKVFHIETPAKTLQQIEAGPDVANRLAGIHLTTREYLIKDESDLAAFVRYVPDIDSETIAEMQDYCAWSRREIGDRGISVPWAWGGIYNQASVLRDVSLLMMDPYINRDFYQAYMRKLTDLMVAYNSEFAKANRDALGIQGNVANAAMMGKDFFDEHVLPYEKELVAVIEDSGSLTVYHNCGRASVLLESYVEMGITAWETVAERPQGDNDLADAKKRIGKSITLIGNLDQVNFLKTASVEEVEQRVECIVRTGKPEGRYIFACSDFLEENTPIENIEAALRAAKAAGWYET